MHTSPFPQPAPGFDDPLGLLRACHMKMMMHCAALDRLPGQLAAGTDISTAVQQIRHYFNTAAHLHHQDEEQNLFPLLLQKDAAFKAIVCELNGEHPQLEAAWQALDAALDTLDSDVDPALLTEKIGAFTQVYRAHIAKEEQQLLMPAEGLLQPDDLPPLGKAMAQRRGVKMDT